MAKLRVVLKPPAGACRASGYGPGNPGVVWECAVGKRHARSGEASAPRPRKPVDATRNEKIAAGGNPYQNCQR